MQMMIVYIIFIITNSISSGTGSGTGSSFKKNLTSS